MATATIDYELQKLIRLLPGYDPFAQSGDCYFEEQIARDVIEFVESCCHHVKGELAGTALILQPWEKALFANLYGWKRPDGTRRYREAFVFVPRGNAKTTLGAAIVCIGLYLDTEPGAELYSSAAEREQARLCFEITAGMIRQEPEMASRAEVLKYSIVVGDKSYKALSAEAGSKHGQNAQLIVNDELHAQKTAELTEVLMTGTGKRRQPLVVHLTTSDYEREGSICNNKHDYASKVRDGLTDDPAFLPVIYEASRDDDWTDPKVWCLAGDTKLYAEVNKGITVCTVQAIVRDLDPHNIKLWDGRQWVRVLGWSKASSSSKKLRFLLRSGQRISCTAHHQWPTQRGKVRADKLRKGDIIQQTVLPGPHTPEPDHIPDNVGWLVGLYLAEGSKTKESQRNGIRRKLQFSGHENELDQWTKRMCPLAAAYHGTCHGYLEKGEGRRCAVVIESRVLMEIVNLYIGGNGSGGKYLAPRVWRRSDSFLRQIAEGYLEGDGSFDVKNGRYRLGFCRNDRLADSLRTLAARLGAQCRIKAGFATSFGERRPVYRGEWRWEVSDHKNCCQDGEVMAIESSSARNFWHLGVENTDGLFALASGVLTYNSKANPNLGISVPLEYLERECKRAQTDPSYENTFKRLHLNIRTEQAFRLIQINKWDACDGVVEIPNGAAVAIGIDGASTQDMASGVVCYNDGESYHLKPHYWCPHARALELEQRGDHTYLKWAAQGLLTLTPGSAIDDRAIRKWLVEQASIYDVREVPYDPYNLTTFAMQVIEEEGIPMVEHRQGTMSMNEPMKLLVRLMLEGSIRHGGHPILRWNMANLAARKDASDNIRPDKAESSGKVDGAVAAIMAVGRASNITEGVSFYDTNTVEFSR